MKLVTASEMRELDRRTIEEVGIPGMVLMENAGRAVAEIVRNDFPERVQKGVLVLAGPGNNGGDGFVAARHLAGMGFKVFLLVFSEEKAYRGDALANLAIARRLGLPMAECLSEDAVREHFARFAHAGVIVDALFGTGLAREVGGRFATAIRLANDASAPVVSVDMPSGISSDTGEALGCAVTAAVTATFGAMKLGLVLHPGAAHAGKVRVVDIGIPRRLVEEMGIRAEFLGMGTVSRLLRPRPETGHKGTFGHLLVFAGSRGKSGAATLAALGALRAGAGLVTVACPEGVQPVLAAKLTEAMTEGIPETGAGTASLSGLERLLRLMDRKRAVAMGPGIGLHEETRELVRRIMAEAPLPMVVDADALTAVGQDLALVSVSGHARVLTPHPGEMARLLGVTTPEVEADRVGAVRAAARGSGAVVVLKGARTIAAAPDGRIAVNSSGNSGMAAGGMGDVLTGLIGSLLAQGYGPWDAARLAVFAHGRAGDILAAEKGPFGYLAGEIADTLPAVWRSLDLGKQDISGMLPFVR
ncbi:MAG: NAD(P)H-hydrate dehydratase [Deltaproteobacteria bacterium]